MMIAYYIIFGLIALNVVSLILQAKERRELYTRIQGRYYSDAEPKKERKAEPKYRRMLKDWRTKDGD